MMCPQRRRRQVVEHQDRRGTRRRAGPEDEAQQVRLEELRSADASTARQREDARHAAPTMRQRRTARSSGGTRLADASHRSRRLSSVRWPSRLLVAPAARRPSACRLLAELQGADVGGDRPAVRRRGTCAA